MTVRAIGGLVVFNAFVLAVGSSLLVAVRGWRSWRDLALTGGLGYVLGIAALGVALSVELSVGVPFSFATVVLTGLALAAAGLLLRAPLHRWNPEPAEARSQGLLPVTIVFGVLVVITLEALFRAGRLASLSAWDAWAFWVPKAKAIYFFGGLDAQFFRELPNPTYPPLLPALEASTFHFMGSADVVTLHLQFWFLACGFAAAIAGVLGPRVSPVLLWPVLLLVLVAPRVAGRNRDPQADFLLDYFFALAALLVALWLVEREPWQLATAAVLMAGALLTKREGLMLVACLVAAAVVGSFRQRRYAWPRLGLVAAGAVAVTIPWRIWFSSRDLTGELPSAGVLSPAEHLDRAWPALDSVVGALFDYDLWLVIVPLVLVAIAVAYLGGARVLPSYALALYVLAAAGFTWVLWAFTELELPLRQDEAVSPIVRLSGSLVVASAGLVPLLLDAAWRGSDEVET